MLAGHLLMELWMEEEENKRKAEDFKIRRQVAMQSVVLSRLGGRREFIGDQGGNEGWMQRGRIDVERQELRVAAGAGGRDVLPGKAGQNPANAFFSFLLSRCRVRLSCFPSSCRSVSLSRPYPTLSAAALLRILCVCARVCGLSSGRRPRSASGCAAW